ncbi:unnamed protein product [Ectocarpus sp. CCAP 1310/34]|nr:unnamed protein product [Ectocarpus sp. CCAP 1310/34]
MSPRATALITNARNRLNGFSGAGSSALGRPELLDAATLFLSSFSDGPDSSLIAGLAVPSLCAS